MKLWPKTRLGRGIMAASFGAAVSLGGAHYYFSNKYASDRDLIGPQDNENVKWVAPAKDVWDEIIDSDVTRFDYGYREHPKNPPGNRTISVQIESSMLDTYGLILEPRYSPEMVLHRHGEAAADIIDITADTLSGKDVNVTFIENDRDIPDWVFNIHNPYTYSLFYNADVITLSMGFQAVGPQKFAYSNGTINTKREIQNADDFWAGTNVVFFKSAGNSGGKSSGMQRSHAYSTMRADTMALIGEASVVEGQPISVEPHSSRSGASFVVSNPFFTGYRYPYVRDEELPDLLDEIYDSTPELYRHYDRSAREIFRDKLTVQLYAPHAIAPLARREFGKLEFEGKSTLEKPSFWQSRNKTDVLEAFKNGVIASGETLRKKFKADDRGGVAKLYGTSFSAPHAAGMFSAMHERYQDLNEYDLLAAALMAAEPVYYVKQFRSGYKSLSYSFNGKLWNNSGAAGFGYLDPESYAEVAEEMARMLDKNPELKTQERKINTGYVDLSQQVPQDPEALEDDKDLENAEDQIANQMPDIKIARTAVQDHIVFDRNNQIMHTTRPDPNTHEYTLHVDNDILALRTNLALEFKGGMAVAPEYVTLINPMGGEVRMSPTRMRGMGDGSYSLATTDGHFGIETKGDWKIRVPDNIEIESARLDISGVERHGLIEKYLDLHIENKASGTTLDLNRMRPPENLPVPEKDGFGPF